MSKVIICKTNSAIPDPIGIHDASSVLINPATNEKLDELKALLSQIESAVDDLEIKADTINLNTDELEAKLQAVKNQLDVLLSTRASESTAASIKTNLDDIKTKLDSLQVELNQKTEPANTQNVEIVDKLDSFSRLQVAQNQTIFDADFDYGLNPQIFDSIISGSGAVNHLPNESAVQMLLSTASGDKVIRQTKQYFHYQSGKSQLIYLVGLMGAKKVGVRQRIGYFDDLNGVFFEQDGNNLKVVERSYKTGSVVDNAINQSAWNLDKLDGTGISGITLDTSKTQIFVFEFQWLGVGLVRLGFNIKRKNIFCHEFLHANVS